MDTPTTFRTKRMLSLPHVMAKRRWITSGTLFRTSRKPHREQIIAALAVLSGVLSTLSMSLWPREGYGFWLGPGLLFGLFFLLPWCRFCQISWAITAATVFLSPIGFAAAVYLVLRCDPCSLMGGLAGSVITFAPLLLEPDRRIRQAVTAALVCGSGVGFFLSMSCLAVIGGVAVWQIAVAYCLRQALKMDDR